MLIRAENFGDFQKITKGSHQKVWFTCENCGLGILQKYNTYINQKHGKFCRTCRNKHTANDFNVKIKKSKAASNKWKDPEYRKHMSIVLPDACKKSWTKERKEWLSKNNPMNDPKIRKKCAENEATSITELIKICDQYNYEYIDRELGYPGTKIIFKCNEGHIQIKRLDSFRAGQWRCGECFRTTNRSQPEAEILNFCKEILPDEKIISNDRTQIRNTLTNFPLELDIWIPNLKKAIEFNGDYWHSDKYIKIKDKIKIIQCKKKNIDLLVIKECEYNKKDIIQILKMFFKDN